MSIAEDQRVKKSTYNNVSREQAKETHALPATISIRRLFQLLVYAVQDVHGRNEDSVKIADN